MPHSRRTVLALLCALSLCLPASAAERLSPWLGTWSTATVPADPAAPLPGPAGPITLRQVVRVTAGGPRIRLRLTNVFGTTPLQISAAHVALSAAPASSAVVPETDHRVTFDGGKPSAVIPAGATYLSDPIPLPVTSLSRLAVSLHLPELPKQATLHRSARTTAYIASGDQTAARDLPGAATVLQWLQIEGVEVERRNGRAVVALGDSITDGSGAGVDRYERWPDILAERLQADPRTRDIAVLNAGIGANRLLKDTTSPNALARFDRDVLAQPGVETLIVLIGVNDIGMLSREGPVTPEKRAAVVQGLIAGYRQVIARAHAHGVRVIGATILPFAGTQVYRSDADAEADRQAVNAWIRTSGAFDGVLDFDRVTRDPARPERLKAEYDSGDLLHPSPAGYKAMGEAIPLGVLLPSGRRPAPARR
jgi:lysophospholipase L1-like esterase